MYSITQKGTILQNGAPVTAYSKIPPRLIEDAARIKGLSLYGETSYHTGRHIYKVGVICNHQGGIMGLFSTESRAAFNKFIVIYYGGVK